MAPPTKFAEAEAERDTLKLTLDALEALLNQHKTTPLDEATANDSLELAKLTQQQLITNQRSLTVYATNDVALAPYLLEYPDQLTRALRCTSGFRGITMKFPPMATPASTTSSSSHPHPADIRLPTLQIPVFSGNLQEWISFRDLFEKAVGNNAALSKAQKLTYLKSYLSGEAARHVTTLVISDANYDVAWATLTNRYQNERELLFGILRRLMNQPSQPVPSATALRNLIDTTHGCIRSLEVISVPVEHWDAIILFILFNKMDQPSRELWEQSLPDSNIPALKNLTDFLEQRARALAAGSTSQPPRGKQERSRTVSAHHTHPHSQQHYKCVLCQQNHPLFRCQKFQDFDIPTRHETVKKHQLCYNCLSSGHGIPTCQNQYKCKLCGRRHHTMLHKDAQSSSTPDKSNTSVSSHHASNPSNIEAAELATARIRVLDSKGQPMMFRALLDGGSPVSFIEESCAKMLSLSLLPSSTQINGIGGASAGMSQAITSFVIQPHFRSNVTYTVKALVLKKITKKVPAVKMANREWNHLQDLRLADPDYATPAPVDILIGSDLFWSLLQNGKISGPPNAPYAIRSSLGWLVAGQCQQQHAEISSFMININLEETVHKFWQAESIPDNPSHTAEERDCENNFMSTHSRDLDGRFCVHIPWKSPRPPLGSSRPQALQRLFQLERRFKGAHLRDLEKLRQLQQHKDDYAAFMQEYEDMGHMTVVTKQDIDKPAVYISHHFVLKETSTTTRLRVVFDASAKTSSGFSLNDAMMVGPTLQDPIHDIILRFGKHNIAFTADVAKMYRQIRVTTEDIDMQRILWRKHPSDPVKEYRLNTVTYGTASAPYLAVKCLQQLAEEEKMNYPTASQIALNDFYVDDVASGCATPSETIDAIRQLNEMCQRAGFPLRKYSCNNDQVLQSIPAELRETTSLVSLDNANSIKILGIYWDPKRDVYKFTINLPSSTTKYTKRIILSEVSMIFDPIGWLSPVIIRAKLIIQDLWRAKLDWNDDIPAAIEDKWKALKSTFKKIEELSIPRCILPGIPTKTILVGFSDASSYGYSACVYTLCYYKDKAPFSTLVTSKTKVAPLAAPTIPRLELNAAVLLASLLKSVIRALKHPFEEVRAFTDSTIVLAWINTSPLRWKTYVRQRVQKITDSCPEAKWFHVRSEENCADCASRGLSPEELVSHPLWWNGNNNMKQEGNLVTPAFPEETFNCVREEEQKSVSVHHTQPENLGSFISRFSSFQRLQRVTSYMFRFIYNTRVSLSKRQFGPLTVTELHHGFVRIIQYVQIISFPKEMEKLQNKKPLPPGSNILQLSPFIDPDGLLRVGGRLRNANIHGDKKHPIMLPQRHPITRMIIADYHENYFHAGPQLMLALLQQRFWLTNARDVIRHQIRKCPTCIRYRGETMKQFMGELPAERVNPSHPFSKCGVDYAGPILTRPPIRSKIVLKSYLAIFICFSTRAIHIEVVESLSTDSFLAALRRFTARRGRPTDIFSDNGTNFVGANRAIKEIVTLCRSSAHNEKIANACSTDGIQWHFNPPNSPHFGGLWEAGVRSVKYHLNRVMGSTRYTYEELLTLVTQIESLLNSRPLSPASTDPADLQVLTPAHLLNGAPLTAIPEQDFTEIKEGRLSRWQHIQQQKQHFWRRWSREYITRLQQRPKWMQVSTNLKINDMVIIKDDNLAPSQWSLGRVVAVHPGEIDGIIRVVTVKTARGEFKRAIHRLCLLPIEQSPPPVVADGDS